MSEHEILVYTPRLRLQYGALLRKCPWYVDVAEELGVEKIVLDDALADYLQMSIRVSELNGALDFEFADTKDTPEQVKEKFMVYLDTQDIEFIDKLTDEINAVDAPADADIAPLEPTEKKA